MSNKKQMNLPNKLTVLRLCLVPIFVVIMMVSDAVWASAVGLVLFIVASLTDMLDGKIARKYNLVTDFGKFMDPLADKFMVIGAMFVILYRSLSLYSDKLFSNVFFWAFLIVIFRELAVTSMRMVVNNTDGIVIAAGWLGKVKTCVQILFILTAIIEPMFSYDFLGGHVASYVTMAAMAVMTPWSGIVYFKGYWKYINPSV